MSDTWLRGGRRNARRMKREGYSIDDALLLERLLDLRLGVLAGDLPAGRGRQGKGEGQKASRGDERKAVRGGSEQQRQLDPGPGARSAGEATYGVLHAALVDLGLVKSGIEAVAVVGWDGKIGRWR